MKEELTKRILSNLTTRLSPFMEMRGLSNDCAVMRLIKALLTAASQCQNNDRAVMRLMKKGLARSQPVSEELKARFAVWLKQS